MENNLCSVCQIQAKHSCSSCHSSFYCSKECQKKGWRTHKAACIPYEINIHPTYGRYVVATRDIQAGEVVMKEIPVVVGPQAMSKPMCLGCHKAVTGYYNCSKCSYPLCSANCEKSIFHEAECLVLSRSREKPQIANFEMASPVYDCILPIRCLLTKFTDLKKWKIINSLQGNIEQIGQRCRERIQNNILDYCRFLLNFTEKEISELLQIVAILLTNSFELMHNGQSIEGVFPKVAMMAHDCSPNTENVLFSPTRAIVRSTVFIPKGASITTTYTYLVWNTLQRRTHLLETKFFLCNCDRCSDPTELNSNMSTLICSQCNCHVVSPQPLNNEAVWNCNNCNFSITSDKVQKAVKILRKSFLERDRSKIRPLDDLIYRSEKMLHPNHQILFEAKLAWIKYCGNHPEYRYKDLSKAQLQMKLNYCNDLLKVMDAVMPGRTHCRGFVLYELHATLRTMAQKLLSFGDLNQNNAKDYMDEADKKLGETREIFSLENEMKDREYENKLNLLNEEFEGIP